MQLLIALPAKATYIQNIVLKSILSAFSVQLLVFIEHNIFLLLSLASIDASSLKRNYFVCLDKLNASVQNLIKLNF